MNSQPKLYLVIFCFLLMHTSLGQPSQGTLVDKVIAQVDNQILLQSELETAYQQYLRQGGEEGPDLKCKILGYMLSNKLLLAKAKRDGVVVTSEEVDQELNPKIKHLVAKAGSETKLSHYWGKSIQEIKNELRETLTEQRMLEKMRDQIIRDITVTPQEVKEFFEALPAHELPYCPAEVEVRQIVCYPQASQQEKNSIIEQLIALKTRIQNGEKFELLAQEYSQDLNSAAQGGDLGFWRLGELAPAYEAAALALQPGEVSDPVATQFGFHLIQLIAREKDQYNSRHILLKPNPEALDWEGAKTHLAKLRVSILDGQITFEQAARETSEDTLTAPLGGLITGEQGGTRIPIDDLPPDVFFAIEQLAPGTIAEPAVFTTSDKRQAVRILMLKARVAPHQLNLAQDYEKVQQMVINAKRTNALQAWLESVKSSTFINVAHEYQDCALLR